MPIQFLVDMKINNYNCGIIFYSFNHNTKIRHKPIYNYEKDFTIFGDYGCSDLAGFSL